MDLNDFNENQKKILKQFREVVKDCQLPNSEDAYLARWLVARDFDIPKAEKMLRSALEWRRQFKIDSILNDFKPPEVLLNYVSAGLVGRDKAQSPLWITRYGRMDMKGILRSAKKRDFVMYIAYLVEFSISKVIEDPKKYKPSPDAIVQTTVIFDLEGLSMQHITNRQAVDVAIKLITLYEANYPEYLSNILVVNAPKVFPLLFAMLKPFIHERTRNKIKIFGHDEKEWKTAILEYVNVEELPVAYGGTMTDPDGNPNCIKLVNMGGVVPKSCYFSCKPDISNKKSLSISRGSKEHLEFPVKEAGAVLKWDFHTEESDIGFAVYRKQGNELIAIVPSDRIDCDMSTEEGELQCDEPGVYVIEFDNGFSYIRSKKIWYAISVGSASLVSQTSSDLDKI
ncbi:SEC14-like protein 2 [Daphnia pulicaria]|uniref:SEC14-like protein 2 n=1 Tax=Daphnia pulicaria TaxID=35523 RepID=UPI001EEBCFC7|nr:SEC14-like protein 2 [Daphnia pulicaria]